MNTDIRLSVGFWGHPKTIKLTRKLGLEGVRSLQVLWLWTTANKPDGHLTDMDADDIEIAADWRGEVGAFIAACVGPWIDKNEDGSFSIHDWEEHNHWQAQANARSEKARAASKARWEKEPKKSASKPTAKQEESVVNSQVKQVPSVSNAQALPEQSQGNAQIQIEECPSPILSSPIQKGNINISPTQESLFKEEASKNQNPVQGTVSEMAPPKTAKEAKERELSRQGLWETPGIDFVEIRDFYNEHFRAEANLVGYTEYKKLIAQRYPAFPGKEVILNDLADRLNFPRPAERFIPSLATYLSTHGWTAPKDAWAKNAAPQHHTKPGDFDAREQQEICRRIAAKYDATGTGD